MLRNIALVALLVAANVLVMIAMTKFLNPPSEWGGVARADLGAFFSKSPKQGRESVEAG